MISYVIINFNGQRWLARTLQAVYDHGFEVHEVIVVDDGSTENDRSWLTAHWPQVRVVGPARNVANMGILRNIGLSEARARHVFLMDNDITLRPGCVQTLAAVLRQDERILCVTPRLLDADDESLIYADGNHLHWLGLSGRPPRGRRAVDVPPREPFDTFACGIMLIDKPLAQRSGGFDPGYRLGWADDAEFQLRGRMLGFKALHVQAAVAVHEGKSHGTKRAYAQMYNRYRLMLTYYRLRTLLLLAPALLLFECALTLASLAGGYWGQRWRAVASIFHDRADWLAARRVIQTQRVLADRQVLHAGVVEAPPTAHTRPLQRLVSRWADRLLDVNWWLVHRWIQ